MIYRAKNFDSLLGIEGLSDQLLKNHFTLYNAYIENTNKLLQELEMLSKEDMTNIPEYTEIKRRLGWEWNGFRLHEYYFSNMTKNGNTLNTNTNLFRKITQDFGSYANWEKDFRATGLIRGIGWVILFYDPLDDRIFNIWINEHSCNHLCGCYPILTMDIFEHAYLLDYGIDKKRYIDAFFKIIDWENVILTSESWFE